MNKLKIGEKKIFKIETYVFYHLETLWIIYPAFFTCTSFSPVLVDICFFNLTQTEKPLSSILTDIGLSQVWFFIWIFKVLFREKPGAHSSYLRGVPPSWVSTCFLSSYSQWILFHTPFIWVGKFMEIWKHGNGGKMRPVNQAESTKMPHWRQKHLKLPKIIFYDVKSSP